MDWEAKKEQNFKEMKGLTEGIMLVKSIKCFITDEMQHLTVWIDVETNMCSTILSLILSKITITISNI